MKTDRVHDWEIEQNVAPAMTDRTTGEALTERKPDENQKS